MPVKKKPSEATTPKADETKSPPADETREIAEPETRTEPKAKPVKVEGPIEATAEIRAEIEGQEKAKYEARTRELSEIGTLANITPDKILEAVASQRSVVDIRKDWADAHTKRNEMPAFGASHIEHGADGDESLSRMIADGMLVRAGYLEFGAKDESRRADESCSVFQGFTPFSLVQHFAQRAGINPIGKGRQQLMRELKARSLQSTASLQAVLANVLNKGVGVAFNEAATTWQVWTKKVNLNDLRQRSINRISALERLGAVNENGEVRTGQFSDEKEVYTPKQWSKIVGITDKVFINDDLQMLTDIPRMMGRAAARTVEEYLWYIILNNPALVDGDDLFSSAHANVGTTGVISETTINEANELMGIQTEPNGAPLAISPRFLIVPKAIEGTARKFVSSEGVLGGTNAEPNIWQGRLQVVSTPFLDIGASFEAEDGKKTTEAGDSDAWYLAADPAQADTMEVGFVDGIASPAIDTEAPIEVLGIQIRGSLNFGIGAADYRGLVYNAGA